MMRWTMVGFFYVCVFLLTASAADKASDFRSRCADAGSYVRPARRLSIKLEPLDLAGLSVKVCKERKWQVHAIAHTNDFDGKRIYFAAMSGGAVFVNDQLNPPDDHRYHGGAVLHVESCRTCLA